jgi:hypothetical protein
MKCLLIGLGALVIAHAAAASPCGDRIAKLQARSDAAATSPSDTTSTAGSAAETADAKLHHQPTVAAGSVNASADSEAALRNARFQNDLFNAQAAEHSGDMAACESAANAAEKELPR